jgi:hypothetical protein
MREDDAPEDFAEPTAVHHHHYRGGEHNNGSESGWSKVRDYIVLGVIGFVGFQVWSMNNRLTSMESLMNVVLSKVIVQAPK